MTHNLLGHRAPANTKWHQAALRAALVVICLCLSACSEPSKPDYSTEKLDKADRIAKVTRLLQSKLDPLPSAIQDAHFAQLTMGSSSSFLAIGPDDYETYLYAKVPVNQVDRWLKLFNRMNAAPGYAAPRKAYPPWVNQRDFSSLEFYEPGALSSASRGWIGVARKTGELFMFSHTM